MISTREEGRQWQLVLGLLSTMIGAGMDVNITQFNAASNACGNRHVQQLILGLISTMVEAQ